MGLLLQQKQNLRLSMTPNLRQSIELLQYSTPELAQFIRQQELENPLIELQENEESIYYVEKVIGYRYSNNGEPFNHGKKVENFRDELFNEVLFTFRDQQTQQLLKEIIYNLDDYGYLVVGKDEIFNLSLTEDEINLGIQLLQQVGPLGIGARDLKECLRLQIQILYPKEILALKILDYLPLLAAQKWNKVAENMKISVGKVKQLNSLIQNLHPKPCDMLNTGVTVNIIPDVVVETTDGEIQFYLNDRSLPKIQLHKEYTPYFSSKCETYHYLKPHYKQYEWLVKSIEQRRRTIINIMNVLLSRQKAFFEKGVMYLNPLSLKEVAEEIGMHPSTITRAVKNKYIQTSYGTFEIRSLFSTRLETSSGEVVSNKTVKHFIQKIIESENISKPYSDNEIAELLLKVEGIKVSRRTINKYREDLNIPSSNARKVIS